LIEYRQVSERSFADMFLEDIDQSPPPLRIRFRINAVDLMRRKRCVIDFDFDSD